MKYSKLTSVILLVSIAALFSCEQGMNLEVPVDNTGFNDVAENTTSSQTLIKDYSFTGQEGDPISLETAKRWTSTYKKNNPSDTRAHFFGFEILKQILEEESSVGIRMYYAIDDQGKRQIVLVGVNAAGENLLPHAMTLSEGDENIVADASFPCPSFCPDEEF